jgi:tetratricopeptide (TPR) repeat protein
MDAKVSCCCGNARTPSQCCLLKISSKPWSGNSKKVTIADACLLLKQALNQRNFILVQTLSNCIRPKVANHPIVHYVIAMQYFLQDQHQSAKLSLELAFKYGLQDPSAYLQYANLIGQDGDYSAALKNITMAIKLKPDFEAALMMGFQITMLIQQFSQAIFFAKSMLKLSPRNAPYYVFLANAYSKNLQDELALEIINEGLKYKVDNSPLLLLKAGIFELRNELDEAQAILHKILIATPSSIDAQLLNSTLLIRQKNASQAKDILLGLINNLNCSAQQIQYIYSNLVKANRLLACYNEVWQNAKQMNLLSAKIRPSVGEWPEIESYFNHIDKASNNVMSPASLAFSASNQCLFIVGFPRSGSTLLEKLLYESFHCHTVGESNAIPELEKEVFLQFDKPWWQLGGKEWDNPALFKCIEKALDVYKNQGWQNPSPLIDKNLLNSSRLILLDKLFPDGPIIKLVRHPLDVLVSNYMNNFGSNDAWHSELDLIAKYMLKVDEHWHSVSKKLNNPVYIIRYEDMVSNLGIPRELEHFVREFWPTQMRNKSASDKPQFVTRTASYAQVQQHINTESVNIYKHYLDYIPKDIINILKPMAERWNYTI